MTVGRWVQGRQWQLSSRLRLVGRDAPCTLFRAGGVPVAAACVLHRTANDGFHIAERRAAGFAFAVCRPRFSEKTRLLRNPPAFCRWGRRPSHDVREFEPKQQSVPERVFACRELSVHGASCDAVQTLVPGPAQTSRWSFFCVQSYLANGATDVAKSRSRRCLASPKI